MLTPASQGEPPADDLAIVIPAYKPEFLDRSLSSISEQTDRRFQVYVGDDCGPPAVREVVESFAKQLPINYQRFENNLGRHSLVRQWERCIALTTEPWVWLFADDDEMEPDCVSSFRRTLAETKSSYPLYRFNFLWIDGSSRVTHNFPPLPKEQDALSFMDERIAEEQQSCAQALIFSRARHDAVGGFPRFPMAWMSDDAFILSMARDQPLRTIEGARVRWRRSDLNISSANSSSRLRSAKLKALMQFVSWLQKTFTSPQHESLVRAGRRWFDLRADHDASDVIPFSTILQLAWFSWRNFGVNPVEFLARHGIQNCRLIARHLRRRFRSNQPR